MVKDFHDFEKKILDTIQRHGMISAGDKIIVGVSGGADSIALLNALVRLKDMLEIEVFAAHVNHNLRGDEATRDVLYVESFCNKKDVQLFVLSEDVGKIAQNRKISVETAGRDVRYEFFDKLKNELSADKIAVAQNKNDNAETVIINMIRGASAGGQKGIDAVRDSIIRPLIECQRQDIEKYLSDFDIKFMTDSTNFENIYTRNIVRNQILPLMKKINPNVINIISDNSYLLKDDNDFLKMYAQEIFEKRLVSHTICAKNKRIELDISEFDDIHISIRRRVIMCAIYKMFESTRGIEKKHINAILNLATGKSCDIRNNLTVYRNYDMLLFTSLKSKSMNFSYNLDNKDELFIAETGKKLKFEIIDKLTFDREFDKNLNTKNITYISLDSVGEVSNLVVRSRNNGDRFVLSGDFGTKKVKDFFIDNKIPLLERNAVPILCYGDDIAAILGYRVDQRFIICENTQKILKVTCI